MCVTKWREMLDCEIAVLQNISVGWFEVSYLSDLLQFCGVNVCLSVEVIRKCGMWLIGPIEAWTCFHTVCVSSQCSDDKMKRAGQVLLCKRGGGSLQPWFALAHLLVDSLGKWPTCCFFDRKLSGCAGRIKWIEFSSLTSKYLKLKIGSSAITCCVELGRFIN